MLIYASYFYYISPELIGFQAIGFSFCRKMQDTTELVLHGEIYALNPEPLQFGCPDETGCEWANMRLQTEIPAQTSVPKNIALKTATSTVNVPVQESVMHERVDGLEVCVAPLYWYNQWMRLIEFVELYQAEGVSHFYIYVSSVSQIVNDILKIYEKKGVVTIVYWPSLPLLGPIDPNAGVFRLGQGTAHTDCMMKSKAKFVAMLDLDDYIVINGSDLLDYLTAESANDPSIGSFQFERSMVQQPVGDIANNWENFTFDHLESAPICDSCQDNFKSIVLPDKVDVSSTHFPVSHRAIRETPDATYRSMMKPLSPKPAGIGNDEISNRWIIYHEQNPQEEPMIILASVVGLACLRDATHIACDGNFKYNATYKMNNEAEEQVDKSFWQVYSLHSIYQDLPERSESVLSVVALLSSKTQGTYTKMFHKVRDAVIAEFGDIGQPKHFHFDMEVSAMNACKAVFGESRITTCYFHFAKNIMDKVKRIGLAGYYSDPTNQSFYNWLRTFIGSALLPRNLFDDILWPYIESSAPEGRNEAETLLVQQFLAYLRTYWRRHRTTWDQYDNDGPRTTNHAEGWHNQLRTLFNFVHPQLGLFMKEIRKEINGQAIAGEKLLRREALPKRRLRQNNRAEERMIVAKAKLLGYVNGLSEAPVSIEVPRTAGVCYHARYALDKTQNYSEVAYTTQQFHASTHVDRLRTNLPDLMNELGAKHQNLSIPDATDYMNTCTKYVVNVCQTPYHTCPKMNDLDEWVYGDNVVQSSYVLI